MKTLFRPALTIVICILVLTTAGCLRPGAGLPLRNIVSPNTSQANKEVLAEQVDPASPTDAIEKEFNDRLMAKDFRSIDSAATVAREKKERLPGGYWKLDHIYEGLTGFYAEYKGQRVTDEMWTNRIEILKQWKIAMPESITARVALAQAYAGHGWFARGSGYANEVTQQDFETLHERLAMARRELEAARSINVQCPRWYREMLMIAMAESWSHEEFDELYNAAIKAEPNYLQAYLVKSEYLTPKWSGEEDDWQKFVDSLPSKLATLKDAEIDIIYLVVVVNKMREPSLSINWAMIAKDRIRNGFSGLDKKYGVDRRRLNQIAFVSVTCGDLDSARMAFERIGDERDPEVWNEQTFTLMKKVSIEGFPKPGQKPNRG